MRGMREMEPAMSKVKKRRFLSAVLPVVLICIWVNADAGNPEPPVPPGHSTMLPLDEVDPRRPITVDMFPLTITEWGTSWYLTRDIDLNGVGGITVESDHVNIDLMGFRLFGSYGTGPAIQSAPGRRFVTVKNGSIQAWDVGLRLGLNSAVRNVAVVGAQFSGIEVGSASLVAESIAYGSGHHGIVADAGSIVRDCVVHNNTQNGIWATTYTSGQFIHEGTLITGCNVDFNDRNGIRVDGHAYVLNNQIRYSDSLGVEGKAGIWVNGDGNRIEGNHITMNNIGIDLDGNNNLIIKNSLIDNPTCADVAPGTTGNVFQIGSTASAGHWANFCM